MKRKVQNFRKTIKENKKATEEEELETSITEKSQEQMETGTSPVANSSDGVVQNRASGSEKSEETTTPGKQEDTEQRESVDSIEKQPTLSPSGRSRTRMSEARITQRGAPSRERKATMVRKATSPDDKRYSPNSPTSPQQGIAGRSSVEEESWPSEFSVCLNQLKDSSNQSEILITTLIGELKTAVSPIQNIDPELSKGIILTPEEIEQVLPPATRVNQSVVRFAVKLSKIFSKLRSCLVAQGSAAQQSVEKMSNNQRDGRMSFAMTTRQASMCRKRPRGKDASFYPQAPARVVSPAIKSVQSKKVFLHLNRNSEDAIQPTSTPVGISSHGSFYSSSSHTSTKNLSHSRSHESHSVEKMKEQISTYQHQLRTLQQDIQSLRLIKSQSAVGGLEQQHNPHNTGGYPLQQKSPMANSPTSKTFSGSILEQLENIRSAPHQPLPPRLPPNPFDDSANSGTPNALKDLIMLVHKELMKLLSHCQMRSKITNFKVIDIIGKESKGKKIYTPISRDSDFQAMLATDLKFMMMFVSFYEKETATLRARMKEMLRKEIQAQLRVSTSCQTGYLYDDIMLAPVADISRLLKVVVSNNQQQQQHTSTNQISGGKKIITTFGSCISTDRKASAFPRSLILCNRDHAAVACRAKQQTARSQLLQTAPIIAGGEIKSVNSKVFAHVPIAVEENCSLPMLC